MAIIIGSSVGEGGKNTPADVVQIDNLLRKAGMLAGGPATPQTRLVAIKKFQEIWGIRTAGKPDGKIDPGGLTLRRLNETVSPLKLKDITLALLGNGGYGISFAPEAPPKPYQLFLGPSLAVGDCLEITGTGSKDVMTAKNLPDLLKIIQKRGAWAPLKLPLKLFLVLNGVVVSESAAQNLDCPVKPHNGKLLPLDTAGNGDKLTYQGDSKEGPFYGRFLQKVPGFDGYFFTYHYYKSDSRFETDPKHRGFDCITYAGAACGAAYASMGGSPADLATALGPTKCTLEIPVPPAPVVKGAPAPSPAAATTAPKTQKIELEKAKPQYIKDFFAKDKAGYYLLWMGSHIVMVADGTVHEFAHSKEGYDSTPVETWLEPYKNEPLTLRKLAGKPALAT